MEIIGHRGAKGLATENTTSAILKGLGCDADMIEIDLRLQNNRIVLSHDETTITGTYCLLKDALDTVTGKKPLILDIKEIEVVHKLPEELKKYKGIIIFSSRRFDALQQVKILQKSKKLNPEAELAIIESWSGIRAVARASLLKTNRIHINQTWLWSNFVRSLNNKGYQLYAYTVNDKERADELAEWGVRGIFTDYPDRFKEKNRIKGDTRSYVN